MWDMQSLQILSQVGVYSKTKEKLAATLDRIYSEDFIDM